MVLLFLNKDYAVACKPPVPTSRDIPLCKGERFVLLTNRPLCPSDISPSRKGKRACNMKNRCETLVFTAFSIISFFKILEPVNNGLFLNFG